MSEKDVIEKIAHDYCVDPTRVQEDLRILLRRSAELDLLPGSILITVPKPSAEIKPANATVNPTPQKARKETAPRMLIAKAILGLALFDTILAFCSFRSLCAVVRSWALKSSSSPRDYTISEVLRATEKAAIYYPKRALCLQRSAVTTCLLRECGIHARMVVGVRPMPFLAHAWVEVEGRVINDFPRVKGFYQSVTSY